MTLRYPLSKGQTLFEAIVAAGMAANLVGAEGYVIICRKCNRPIHEHETEEDCERFRRLDEMEKSK